MSIDNHTARSSQDATTKQYFIYSLTDPRNKTVFYVGCTTNLQNRLKEHMVNSISCNSLLKYDYIAGMKLDNVKPIMDVLDVINTNSTMYAFRIEGAWIRLMELRLGTLLNTNLNQYVGDEEDALYTIARYKELIDKCSKNTERKFILNY